MTITINSTANHREQASNARPLPISQTPANTGRPKIQASISRNVYSTCFCWVLIAPTHEGMVQAESTWVPGPRGGGVPVLRRSLIQALTGPGVKQLR